MFFACICVDDFDIWLWNYSDSVVFFVFHLLLQVKYSRQNPFTLSLNYNQVKDQNCRRLIFISTCLGRKLWILNSINIVFKYISRVLWRYNINSDGKQFHQYQQQPPLTSNHWIQERSRHDVVNPGQAWSRHT